MQLDLFDNREVVGGATLSGTALPPLGEYRPAVNAALVYAGGTHTFEDIAEGVAQGRYQFWPGALGSVVVTELVQYPRSRGLHIFLAAGRLRELEAMTPHILAWGRAQGCDHASLTGRMGWLRSFLTCDDSPAGGWGEPLVMLSKRL